jgi:hypothetical protein
VLVYLKPKRFQEMTNGTSEFTLAKDIISENTPGLTRFLPRNTEEFVGSTNDATKDSSLEGERKTVPHRR